MIIDVKEIPVNEEWELDRLYFKALVIFIGGYILTSDFHLRVKNSYGTRI